jgi:ligand-binding SRPBCC domain-containing protein
MGFDIISENLPDKMYPGMIICYRVKPLFGIPVTWVTEITQVVEKKYFIDQQRSGPYALWHHQHFIEKSEEGILMTDIISYKPPLGFLGKIANKLFIRKKLEEIFNYRREALIKKFPG